MNQNISDLREQFITSFGSIPMVVRSPGRVNIIGEHTDYNDGLVLPAAIDLAVCFFIQKREDGVCNLEAVDLNQSFSFGIDDDLNPSQLEWVNYFLGVVAEFRSGNHSVHGFDLMFASDIPMGAGLSSSAAIECGFAYALSELFGLDLTLKDIAKIGQSAEHRFVGVQCGIMDQYACCMGKQGQAIKLDCRSLTHEYIPISFNDHEFVLFDSCVKHKLVDTQYNLRRAQCESGLALIRESNPSVKSLRDVSLQDLIQFKPKMDPTVFQRCQFVVSEIDRVNQASEALVQGDAAALGQLMTATHIGLRDEYEVSCLEVDLLIGIAGKCQGFLGGRMMGGGFGGCTINLVEIEHINDIITEVTEAYYQATDIKTKVHRVTISDGIGILKPEKIDEFRP